MESLARTTFLTIQELMSAGVDSILGGSWGGEPMDSSAWETGEAMVAVACSEKNNCETFITFRGV